jgi:preprotein translocase subunit SecE
VARDRKRAKQRQRRAAQRQSQPARSGRSPEPETEPEESAPAEADHDHTIADLEHGSSGADIAKAAIAAGSVDPGEVSEELDDELGHDRRKGEIFDDEVVDDGYDSTAAEVEAEGADVAAAATVKPHRREREPARKGGNRLTTFLRNSWEELKRVQWPDRRQVAQATGVVIVFVVIIGLYLGAADYVFSKLVDAII